ncbi:MAG: pyridoxamine 5'-phosphate oxidase family protein [Anaerolineae bacterium]
MARYHMHKSEREIDGPAAIERVLLRGKYATLALCRDQEPYVVTLNYGYDRAEQALYFHSALEGLKLDFIRENARVCGTVIEDKGYLAEKCSHAYRSVVFWGDVAVVEDPRAKRDGLRCMIEHLEENADAVYQRLLSDPNRLQSVTVLRLRIKEITGKVSP